MKFAVSIEEIVRHTTVVEADTKEDARAKAEQLLLDEQLDAFQTAVAGREFVGSEVTA